MPHLNVANVFVAFMALELSRSSDTSFETYQIYVDKYNILRGKKSNG